MSRPQTREFPDLESLVSAAAEDLVGCIERFMGEGGRCRVAVAGGSTPRPVYRLVAGPELASRIAWERVDVFWGDERWVPPTDPASNYRMVQEELLARVPIPPANVHRVEIAGSPEEAAEVYARQIGDQPLDLVLLGMGGDGHTASLFPDTPGLGTHAGRAIATTAPSEPSQRISLTLRTINEAGAVRFWVAGSAKAQRVAEVFEQIEGGMPLLPAARVQPQSGRLCWFVDAGAAQELRSRPGGDQSDG